MFIYSPLSQRDGLVDGSCFVLFRWLSRRSIAVLHKYARWRLRFLGSLLRFQFGAPCVCWICHVPQYLRVQLVILLPSGLPFATLIAMFNCWGWFGRRCLWNNLAFWSSRRLSFLFERSPTLLLLTHNLVEEGLDVLSQGVWVWEALLWLPIIPFKEDDHGLVQDCCHCEGAGCRLEKTFLLRIFLSVCLALITSCFFDDSFVRKGCHSVIGNRYFVH